MLLVNDMKKKIRNLIIALLLIFTLVGLVDITTIFNPQKYLYKYSTQGVEMISYYRVKIALMMGADVNEEYDGLSTPLYSSYVTKRVEIFNILLPLANCESLSQIVNSNTKNDLFDLSLKKYNEECVK